MLLPISMKGGLVTASDQITNKETNMAVGAAAKAIVAWALRGTKYLAPTVRVTGAKSLRMTQKGLSWVPSIGKKVDRGWIKKVAVGEKSWLGNIGIGETGRGRFVKGYAGTYKHVKKHKKLYGAAGAGAAVWDFLPGKDND